MKTLSYLSIIFFLSVSCQKEKLLLNISLNYEVSENGMFNGKMLLDDSNYQINYGDGSPLETGTAYINTPILLKHKYNKKSTFNLIITATNRNGTSTQNKEITIKTIAYQPSSDFKYSLENNGGLRIDFTINNGDIYEINFGDGQIIKDTVSNNELSKNYPFSLSHQYKNNDKYKVKLTISNLEGKDSKEQEISIINVLPSPIADFSYEILENGKVKFTNLSKNPQGYKWRIGDDFTYSNSGDYFYTSTEKDPIITIDLNGNYQVRLSAEGDFYGNADKEIGKTINVKSAKSEMTFIGLYNNNKVIKAINGLDLKYSAAFGGGAVDDYGFYQKLWLSGESNILNFNDFIYSKFYPLPYNRYNPIEPTKEDKYNYLKKYLTQINDPDIIEVTEETLDPLFYNNTENFYPKAFWVRYKVKNETLDGELKVRIMVYGSK